MAAAEDASDKTKTNAITNLIFLLRLERRRRFHKTAPHSDQREEYWPVSDLSSYPGKVTLYPKDN